MNEDRLQIVIIGHIDHGKSSLAGRLLLETGSLPEDRLKEVEAVSSQLGKDAELAFLTDQLREEREGGITIDTTQVHLRTAHRRYILIDTPGHPELVRNMMTGACSADFAILVVDGAEGVQEQTRRHLALLQLLDIGKVVAVVNKMDLCEYDRGRFETIARELAELIVRSGRANLGIVPVSARFGVNFLATDPVLTPWYGGKPLIQILDDFLPESDKEHSALRLPVQDVYEIDGESFAVGRVLSGEIAVGQRVLIHPDGGEASVRKIALFESFPERAGRYDNVGIALEPRSYHPLKLRRGMILTAPDVPILPVARVSGRLFWMNEKALEVGENVTVRSLTQESRGRVESLQGMLNTGSLEPAERDGSSLAMNEIGQVSIALRDPFCLEQGAAPRDLSRFTVHTGLDICGAGVAGN